MKNVTLKVIGCGDAFGSGGQLNTCFYLETHSSRVLLDCGASSLPALRSNVVPLLDVDTIIITHFHGDHYGGLPFVLLYLATYGQKKALNIVSPAGGKEKLEKLTALLYPGSIVLPKLTINFFSFEEGIAIKVGELDVEAHRVLHTPEAEPHGVRVTVAGKIISYSGDTEWTESLVRLADQADLFICECCFYTMDVKGHLNYLQLQENLPKLNYKKILLTHFDKEMLINLKNVSLDYAVEGVRYEV